MSKKARKINKEKVNENDNEDDIEEIRNDNDIELEKISKGVIFEKIYNYLSKGATFIFNTTIFFFKISGVYILWIFLHYFCTHLYVNFCVPKTFVGFIMSPFIITTPHCQALRWVVYNAASIINNMWIILGAWIYSLIWVFNTNIPAVHDEQ